MAETIAICSQKGGVAKTTTCLSLGACLSEMGKLVLLIDLDPQANLTVSLGLKPRNIHRTVEDALLGHSSLVGVSQESDVYGLDIVPANEGLSVLDRVLYGRPNYEFRLKNALKAIEGELYDYVVIDCPPSLGTLTTNALTASDLLILPVQCEYYAAYTLRNVIRLCRKIRKKTNPDLTYRVLVTMYDRRNKICRVILNRMQNEMSEQLFNTIIEIDTKLRESPVFGQPITTYEPKTRGARQYRALARELVNHDG